MTPGALGLPALLAFLIQIILLVSLFRVRDEMAVALGKLFPDGAPLGGTEGMLSKIYSGSDFSSEVFDVSVVTMNSGFSRIGFCLPKASCDCPERVTEVHDDITYLRNCPGENDFNHRNLVEILISK